MSEIKLEVGKTYINRKGEEVGIVSKGNAADYPYRGSNGELYAESGRFDLDVGESEYDLIEEVPEPLYAFITPDNMKNRYSFAIPEGATRLTVEQVSNRIIVEMVPEKAPKPRFKEGDIVFEDGRIMMVKRHPNLYHALIHGSPDRLHVNGSYGIPFTSEAFRLATPEEAQPLFDALKKAGKRWNAETMQVEDVPEIERIREWVWANLKSDLYDKSCIAEAIEAYLKYKEGEK